MSLEAMAKSRTRYASSPERSRQPIVGASTPDSKFPIDVSGRKNPSENFMSPEASVASLSESSSNCKYETSSEGHPRRVEEVEAPRPIDPSPNEDVRVDASRCRDGAVETPRRAIDAESSVREIFEAPAIKERSESLPVVTTVRSSDSMDRASSRRNDDLDRIARAESSHARLRQFKKIVAYVESMDWSRSDVSVRGEIPSEAFTASNRSNAITESANFNPVLRKSYGIVNKTTGVTFLTLNEDNDADTRGRANRRRYRIEKSLSGAKPISMGSAIEIIDSMNLIADNPTPSEKSIFFPANPDDCSITSELRSMERDGRNSRVLARNPRSELDALSRIEDELVPLQNEFNKLARKVRALNLTEPYKFRVDPCAGSVDRSSVMSRDTSGYFLHRARVFYRNDLSGNSPLTYDSNVLPTVDNSFSRDPLDASSIWQKNRDIDDPRGRLRRLGSSFVPSRSPCEHSLRLDNNVDPFLHEKPFAYGMVNDFPVGRDDRLEKPACFASVGRRSARDRYHWSQWGSPLPTDGLPRFNPNPERRMDGQHGNVQRPGASREAGGVYTESDDNDFHFIDSKIVLPLGRKESSVDDGGHQAPRKIAEHSCSHRTSDVSIGRAFSRPSQCHDRHSGAAKNRRRVDKNEISAEALNRDKKSDQRGRSKRSSVNESGQARLSDKIRRESEERTLREKTFSSSKRSDGSRHVWTSPSTDLRTSNSMDGIVDSSDNSRSLDIQTKTSFVSYSGVLKPSGEHAESSDDGAIVEEQRIKFMGTYTERTIVRTDSSVKSAVCDSRTREISQFHELSDNPGMAAIAGNLEGYDEDSADRRENGKRMTLPISEEKITVVPVMYTAGIPEQLEKFDLPTCPKRKIGKKRSSNRHRAALEKVGRLTDRSERSSVRNDLFLSRTDSRASTSFASRSSRLTDRDSCVSGHEESSWHGHWRRDSRLSIAFDHGNASISVSSTTVNTERTLTTAETASTMSRSSKVSRIKRDKFPGTNSSRVSKTMDSNDFYSRRRQYNVPMNSARRRNNESSIGVRISPDDFLDDA